MTRARARVLRTKQAWSIPGRTTSSTNVPRPASRRGSSTRCTRLPAYLVAPGLRCVIVLCKCLAQVARPTRRRTGAAWPRQGRRPKPTFVPRSVGRRRQVDTRGSGRRVGRRWAENRDPRDGREAVRFLRAQDLAPADRRRLRDTAHPRHEGRRRPSAVAEHEDRPGVGGQRLVGVGLVGGEAGE
jgi:hypothetical protein